MVGEIYLAKIFFTDLKEFKIRPVLIIKELKNDVICLQLSTKIKPDRIVITNSKLVDGFMKSTSIAVIPKNFTISKSILGKYIGKIDDETFKIIYEKFCQEIGCKNE